MEMFVNKIYVQLGTHTVRITHKHKYNTWL